MIEFFTIALGLTYLVTGASLTRPLRVFARSLHPVLGTLLSCPPCAGFWVGVSIHWRYEAWASPLESGVAACALGAVWSAVQVATGAYEPTESTHAEASENVD